MLLLLRDGATAHFCEGGMDIGDNNGGLSAFHGFIFAFARVGGRGRRMGKKAQLSLATANASATKICP